MSWRRVAAAVGTVALTLAAVVAVQGASGPAVARADTAPAAASGLPATVSADPLPTVQTNGVVWATLTIGKTTYATGNFSYVRPAGMAPSADHAGQTRVGGVVAFNTATGVEVPLTTLHPPTLNGPGYAIAASPDGKTIYVGGSFTTANGAPHAGIVVFDAATGAIVPFNAQVPGEVDSLVVTATTVYAGGRFLAANGVARSRLAAFTIAKTPTDPTNGALTTWAPVADSTVMAMVLTPDHSRLVVAGRFGYLNRVLARGMGAVDATSGATKQWAANGRVHDWGSEGAIDTLSSDGTKYLRRRHRQHDYRG